MTYSVLGIDTKTGQRVAIYKLSRLLGLYCVGLQRMGKSGLFEELIIQDIKQGTGVCVLDPHGELIDHIIARLRHRAEEAKVILLDITDEEHPFGLNLFACADPTNDSAIMKPLRQVLHTFEKAYGISPTTPLMYDLLYKIAYVLIANPDYSMVDIPLFLTNEACRKKLVQNVTDATVRTFWEHWDDPKQKVSKESEADSRTILNKLNDFSHAPLRNIIGQSSSTINLQEIMDAGNVLLIKLSRQLEQATSLIGSIIVALILNAADTRRTNKLFNLYADEFQNFATEDFAVLLEQSPKRAIGVAMAHQNRAQLETSDKQAEANLRARTLNVGNLIVFRVPTDAHELAGQFDITPAPERLEEIEKEELLGHRPVRTYKGDVIGHLLHQGHEDERVMVMVKGCLEKLRLASLKKVDYHRNDPYPINHLGIEYDPERIPGVLADLNTWLFAGMQDRSALWQSLPLRTHWYLLRFFGITRYSDQYQYEYWLGHHVWHAPVSYHALKEQEYAEKRWHEFRTNGFAEEAAYSGISRDRLFNAAIAAVEAGFVDFLTGLFPNLTPANIREAWRQSGLSIPSCTHSQMRLQALRAYKRILAALLEETARQPGLDAALYTQRFLEELSRPRNAVELFLPVLYNSYSKATYIWKYDGQYLALGGSSYRTWRTIGEVVAVTESPYYDSDKKRLEMVINKNKNRYNEAKYLYNLKLTLRFTYHLELLTDNIRLGIIQGMQAVLPSFLSSLRFFASLHCAQLALNQRPIETMDSGQYEQDKRTQSHYIMHSQRPYPDMEKQIAAELVKLPKYTARVKLTDENNAVVEYRITTMKPDTGIYGKPLQDRIERIRERNTKAGYLRDRTVVEAEIRRRQAQWKEPPPADEPPIFRHPPR
jgi:hypothetical protein